VGPGKRKCRCTVATVGVLVAVWQTRKFKNFIFLKDKKLSVSNPLPSSPLSSNPTRITYDLDNRYNSLEIASADKGDGQKTRDPIVYIYIILRFIIYYLSRDSRWRWPRIRDNNYYYYYYHRRRIRTSTKISVTPRRYFRGGHPRQARSCRQTVVVVAHNIIL